MTAWTTLSNTAVGVGGIPSGATVTALRDNISAVAEGSSGAPKVMPPALDLFLGGGAINSTGTTFTGINCLALMLMFGSTQSVATSYSMQVRFSNDGGSTFGAWQSIWTPGGATSTTYSSALVYLDIGATPEYIRAEGGRSTSAPDPYGTLTHPGGTINAIGIRTSNPGMSGLVNIFGIGTEA